MMNYGTCLKGMIQKNHEGGEAYRLSPEMELYTAVVTSALEDMNYEGMNERVDRIVELIGKVAPEFVARLAVYARTVMNLRSIPLLLAVELARIHHGDDLVCRTVERIVCRADEIMELLTCYQWRNPSGDSRKKLGRLSRQIQNGLQQAFIRFDEYQFAKYDVATREVKLRDALFLVHPKAKDEAQQALFDRIASRSLAVPYTWETELSALGQQPFATPQEREEAFGRKWEELIMSGRLGYMALLRNLRNILQRSTLSGASRTKVVSRLSDPDEVARARQLPFRYLSAYRELVRLDSPHTSGVLEALERAVALTAGHLSGFGPDTRVLVASDVSGSMYTPVSRNSAVRLYDIGLLLSMLLKSRCRQVTAGIFGDTWKVCDFPSAGILASVERLYARAGEVGYSTNGHKVVEWMLAEHIEVDKVMMFTDCQLWDSEGRGGSLALAWQRYKAQHPQARLYLFDLAGYGQAPVSVIHPGVYLIAGWSDKVFDVLEALERGGEVLEQIERIPL